MQESAPAISDKSKINRKLSSSRQIAEIMYKISAVATPSAIHPSNKYTPLSFISFRDNLMCYSVGVELLDPFATIALNASLNR